MFSNSFYSLFKDGIAFLIPRFTYLNNRRSVMAPLSPLSFCQLIQSGQNIENSCN